MQGLKPEENLAFEIIKLAIRDIISPKSISPNEANQKIEFQRAKRFLMRIETTIWGELCQNILNLTKVKDWASRQKFSYKSGRE